MCASLQLAVPAPREAPVRRSPMIATGLPAGRRTTAGRVCWYAVASDEGREDAEAARLLKLIPRDVLCDAFVLRREKWEKHAGVWNTVSKPVYRGYLFLASPDAVALNDALAHLSFPVRVAGVQGRGYLPLDPAAQAWFAAAMDRCHVIRSSLAVVVDGAVRVLEGPLAGQEARICRVDRRRRACTVRIGHADGAFEESMPLDIPFKGTGEEYAVWCAEASAPGRDEEASQAVCA